MDYLNDENDLASRRKRGFADLQNEIAGRETGRQARFLTTDGGGSEVDKKRRAERAFRNALDALLASDPEYRALYEELGEALGAAEANADTVISKLQSDLSALDGEIADMRDRAARLPDGRRVFRFADGRVVDENGETLPIELAEGIQWPIGAPSGEAYFGALEQHDDLSALLSEWHAYRNDTLGGIRDRYDDRDDPMAKGDLRDALGQIANMAPKTDVLSQSPDDNGPTPVTKLSGLAVPTALK